MELQLTTDELFDVKVALLDYRLIELLSTVDSSEKMPNDNLKYILKSITHKYVPKELVDRPKKGFALPIVELFREEFIDYLNLSQLLTVIRLTTN